LLLDVALFINYRISLWHVSHVLEDIKQQSKSADELFQYILVFIKIITKHNSNKIIIVK